MEGISELLPEEDVQNPCMGGDCKEKCGGIYTEISRKGSEDLLGGMDA